jgi:hypothetical protein
MVSFWLGEVYNLNDVPIRLNLGRKSLFLMVPQRLSKRNIYERHVFDEHVLDYTIILIFDHKENEAYLRLLNKSKFACANL